jgi:uncharacterized protein YfcZ (UPF0381/DUF406 family)
MQAILPIEVYEALERNIGHDDAKLVVKSFETAISANIEYTWVLTKDDLLSEMEKKFATKADLNLVETRLRSEIKEVRSEIKEVRSELKADIQAVKYEMRLFVLIIIFVIILNNPKSLEVIAKIFGIIK